MPDPCVPALPKGMDTAARFDLVLGKQQQERMTGSPKKAPSARMANVSRYNNLGGAEATSD